MVTLPEQYLGFRIYLESGSSIFFFAVQAFNGLFNGITHSNIVSVLLGAVTSTSSRELCGDVKYIYLGC